MTLAKKPSKSTGREKWAWYFYDFGNSAYAAVVLLAVYSAYFQGTVAGGSNAERLWGTAVAIAMIFVAITAPILGTIADFSGSKKKFLAFYTLLAVVFCGFLFFVQPGNIFIGMLFFILAEIGYRSSQVFYNALLPEIANQDEMAEVSGNGWAFGSFGGIICLVIVLAAIMFLGDDGAQLLPTRLIVRLSLVFTAVYFAIFALPIFMWLREKAEPHTLPEGENYLSLAFKRLAETFHVVRNYRQFLIFMVAFLIYNDGILMILDFGSQIGQVLYAMDQTELMIFMIIVQVTSVIGAYVFGIAAGRMHNGKMTIALSLVMLIAPVIWLYFSYNKVEFYIIGAIAGLALTGVQSVSRSLVGMFSPPGKSAEFYGFFAVAGRTSSFIGPFVFGVVAERAQVMYALSQGVTEVAAKQMGLRTALFSIAGFLLIGLFVLLFVNEREAKDAAILVPEAVAAD